MKRQHFAERRMSKGSRSSDDEFFSLDPSTTSDNPTFEFPSNFFSRVRPFLSNEMKRRRFAGQEVQRDRHETNTFSFKNFLKNGKTNYHSTGARPKVYYTTASSPSSLDGKNTTVYSSRNPTELPDFVQDHLVIEQCYLNHEPSNQQVLLDVDNLPDFALNSVEQRQSRLRSETNRRDDSNVLCDLFDFAGILDKGLQQRDTSTSNAMHSNHLDLPDPSFEISNMPTHHTEQSAHPSGIEGASTTFCVSVLIVILKNRME